MKNEGLGVIRMCAMGERKKGRGSLRGGRGVGSWDLGLWDCGNVGLWD